MYLGTSTFLGVAAYLGEPAPEPTPAGNGWYSLLSILQSGRDEAGVPHREDRDCPNDGTPLQQGPHGVLYCPFDGYRSGDQRS